MTDVNTWGWYAGSVWPGYNAANQDNLGANGNGHPVNPAHYVEFVMRDANSDGVIYDHDHDDVHPADFSEFVFGPNLTLYPQEIALYTNSTMVIDGVTYTGLNIEVTLFTDGTWGARLMDNSIPPGTHHAHVSSVTLGTFNGIEYDGIYTSGVDAPFVCFTRGTQIETPAGPVAVEDLRPGMQVLTLDAGAQPVEWVGTRRVAGLGKQTPIEIVAGGLGNPGPVQLSPQHRVLLGGAEVLARFGQPEVLAAVKHLVDGVTILPRPCAEVSYYHFLLPRHHIVLASGVLAETLYPGPEALRALGRAASTLLDGRAAARHRGPGNYGPTARPVLRGREARSLASSGASLRPACKMCQRCALPQGLQRSAIPGLCPLRSRPHAGSQAVAQPALRGVLLQPFVPDEDLAKALHRHGRWDGDDSRFALDQPSRH